MEREEIHSRLFNQFKAWASKTPHSSHDMQLSTLFALFPEAPTMQAQRREFFTSVREVLQQFEQAGLFFFGIADDSTTQATAPWITLTSHGVEVFTTEEWLPYDPDGYIKALKTTVPTLDSVTLAYITESVVAFNRRHLLSATITLGVASENLMLMLIEAYGKWMKDSRRKAAFEKNTKDRFIAAQYKIFKAEFAKDKGSFSPDVKANWETYLDGVFNFIRLNRNDAGHPTGKPMDGNVVYANLQMFRKRPSTAV